MFMGSPIMDTLTFCSAVCLLPSQSHASYSRCGLGSHGTDRIVALVRAELAAAVARGEEPALYGAKITGGGSGGARLFRF